MPGKTSISWTDRSWNPTTGCTRVSSGCDNCYAFTLHDQRHAAWLKGDFPDAPKQYHKPFAEVQLMPDRLTVPLRWAKPSRIFVDSMADLFHADVPTEFIAQVFATMAMAPQHVFQVLTKRPQRMERLLNSDDFRSAVHINAQRIWVAEKSRKNKPTPLMMWPGWPLPNVWIGVSVENQDAAYRIPSLLAAPAAIHFLSMEPLLGPVDLTKVYWQPLRHPESPKVNVIVDPDDWDDWRFFTAKDHGIKWVIAGGESGAGHREMNPAWLTDLWLQCRDAGVAFWCKQDSGSGSGHQGRIPLSVWETKQFPSVPAG